MFFKESEKTFLNINDLYLNTNGLYKLENDNINTEDVILFKNKLEHVILVPTFSEEFPSFQMVGISKNKEFFNYGLHTYSLDNFEKLEGAPFDRINYQIKKLNNELRIYAIVNKKEILLSDYAKMENAEIPITPIEKYEIKELQKNVITEKSTVTTHNIILDLDSDGQQKKKELVKCIKLNLPILK